MIVAGRSRRGGMALSVVRGKESTANAVLVPRRPQARALAVAAMLAGLGACARPSPIPRPGERAVVAPDSFRVAFETTRGRFDVVAHRAWAPAGVDRFYDLVRRRYYDDVGFFRVV